MNSIAVKNLLSGVASSVDATVQFGVKPTDYFNYENNTYPAINIDPLNYAITFQGPTLQMHKAYSISGVIYKISQIDDTYEQVMTDVDPLETMLDDFVTTLNNEDNVQLSNIQVRKFDKILDDCISGLQFTFTLTVPDDYNYC